MMSRFGKPHTRFQFDNKTIPVWWDGFEDSESGILGYVLKIESYEGDVIYERHVGLWTSTIVGNLDLPVGLYRAIVTAQNGVGLESFQTSDWLTIVQSSPVIRYVSDVSKYPSNDAEIVGSEVTPIFAGYYVTGDQSGIVAIQWCISQYPFQSFPDIQPWTLVGPEGIVPLSYNLVRYNGRRLYVGIYVENAAGNPAILFSNGFVVDLKPPDCQRRTCVSAYFSPALQNQNIQPKAVGYTCTWQSITDYETSIAEYYVRATCGVIMIEPWIRVAIGNIYSNIFIPITLVSSCRCEVMAVDQIGHSSVFQSALFTVDMTPPEPGNISLPFEEWTLTRHIIFYYSGFHDPESKFLRYDMALMNGVQDIDELIFTPCSSDGTDVIDLKDDCNNCSWIIVVKATNYFGLSSIAVSNNFHVDVSPPSITSFDVQNSNVDSVFQSQCEYVSIVFACMDQGSGVDKIEVGLGYGYIDVSVSRGWRNLDSVRIGNISEVDLKPAIPYYARLRCFDKAGQSQTSEPRRVICDDSPPRMVAVRDIFSDLAVDFDLIYSRDFVEGAWDFYDEESSVCGYYVALSTLSCNTNQSPDLIPFRSVGKVQNAKLKTPFTVNSGVYYFFVIAQNCAGLNSSAHCSDGFAVVESLPVCENVQDGKDSDDMNYTSDSASAAVAWSCSTPTDGFSYFEWSLFLVNNAGENILFHFERVSGFDVSAWVAIDLIPGKKYFSRVTATDKLGLSVWKDTDGFIVDTSGPVVLNLTVGSQFFPRRFLSDKNHIQLFWSCFDEQSGVLNAFDVWAVDLASRMPISDVYRADSNRATIGIPNAAAGTRFCIELECVNMAGIKVKHASSDMIIDDTIPSCGDFMFSCDLPVDMQVNGTVSNASCTITFHVLPADIESDISALYFMYGGKHANLSELA